MLDATHVMINVYSYSQNYLVGRKLTDGNEIWSVRMDPIGLPSVFRGRLFVTATTGLKVIQGSSGSVLWDVPGDPLDTYSYEISPTFDDETGQMVAVRCMQSDLPTLCMYSAFEPPNSNSVTNQQDWNILLFLSIFIFHLMV